MPHTSALQGEIDALAAVNRVAPARPEGRWPIGPQRSIPPLFKKAGGTSHQRVVRNGVPGSVPGVKWRRLLLRCNRKMLQCINGNCDPCKRCKSSKNSIYGSNAKEFTQQQIGSDRCSRGRTMDQRPAAAARPWRSREGAVPGGTRPPPDGRSARHVLDVLLGSHKPLGAYEIMGAAGRPRGRGRLRFNGCTGALEFPAPTTASSIASRAAMLSWPAVHKPCQRRTGGGIPDLRALCGGRRRGARLDGGLRRR